MEGGTYVIQRGQLDPLVRLIYQHSFPIHFPHAVHKLRLGPFVWSDDKCLQHSTSHPSRLDYQDYICRGDHHLQQSAQSVDETVDQVNSTPNRADVREQGHVIHSWQQSACGCPSTRERILQSENLGQDNDAEVATRG